MYLDEILAVGSSNNLKVESLNTDEEIGSWVVAADNYEVPTGYDGIYDITIVFVNNAFYVFGGIATNFDNSLAAIRSTSIGRFDTATRKWSVAGSINTGRFQANTIFDGSSVLVVGGEGLMKTEVCKLDETGIFFTCIEQDPILQDYKFYPELFLVPVDFCKV